MKKNLTIELRDLIPNPVRYVGQTDGLWTVYETGDELPVIPTQPINCEVTARQFKLALLYLGLFDEIEIFLSTSTELRIWFNTTQEFHSKHPLVLSTGATLGLSVATIDLVFELASTL